MSCFYHCQATSVEELSIYDGEELEVLESEGDGWCRTKNKNGKIGFVPESYIEIKSRTSKAASVDSDAISRASSISGSITQSEIYQEFTNMEASSNTDAVTDFGKNILVHF